ncbi:condensin complex subunit 1 [Anastrepha ludens]|uniref:condensin complex subunit 1 n=1 Tax=Anastrepha ludens TaxID=28586 RepID=UPI0023B00C2B|nr:condensin complex subunit 1 [Anastrepha ludens]XP_053963845.1 condensin complex subunit 1 [Anastrepha ludens]
MDFQFVLPSTNAELLNSSGDSYYVKQVYAPNEIGERLRVCKQMVQQGDPFYIFDHFDTYFTIIESRGCDAASITNLMRSFDLLYITVDKLGQRLAPVLACSDTAQSLQDRQRYLNLTKMLLFLQVNTVRRLDSVASQAQQQQQQQLQQKKRLKQTETLEQYPDWDSKRGRFLVQLYNILQFPLEKLWNPPVAEENFVNLICDICYRTLELIHSRSDNRHITDTVFQIFGTAIKRYNHALTFPVRVLQILRTSEHAALSIASGINVLYEEYGISSVFSVLIKDIVETLSVDSVDTVVSRNFSNFLMELATIAPKLMIPHLSTLADELLNCESHTLRNCILQIMGDAIVGELTSEELSEELKEARNEFLENLLAHINDVSAHVRAKVLQIWNNMKEENAVPLSFQLKVLCEAVERLEDKTSSVRKQAVQLIKSFLERNPFAAKLTLEELIKKHAEECEKMEKLSEVLGEERKKAEELDGQWNLLIPEILPIVEQNLKECTEDLPENTQENYEDMIQRISTLLLEKKYREAVVLVRKADQVAGNAELRHTLKLEEQCAYYMALLKSYIFLANGCKDSNEELGTQIKTVQFLQDSIEFSKVITKAVPKIQELLLSKTNSDVFEAVDLFTTGYMFGIKGTEGGMRQMLYLVWSSDKEKRDSVSNAYKKVLFTTDQSGRTHAIKVVQNLMRFLEELEYGHYTAMECLMHEWVSTDDIDAAIIQVLFERFTLKLEGTSDNESRLALQLLIMASNSKPSIASANMNVIETIGLGERAKADPRIYTGCIEFMLNSIDSSTHSKFYKRYETDSPLVQKVTDLFQRFYFHPSVPDFDKLTMRTLEFFFNLCQTPDVICQKIVVGLLKKLRDFAICTTDITPSQQERALETPFSQPIPESQSTVRGSDAKQPQQQRLLVYLVTRFLFTIGYMTLKEMIFLDIDVYNNMKFRQELTECEEKKKKNAFNTTRRKTGNLNMSATESLKRLSGTAAEPQQEPDEDLVGATAEDNIAELINHICEDVLLYAENSLLAKIFPYVMEICKYPVKYRHQSLQQAATLTLIRFMCVSSRFCEANMPFLMNILSHTKNIKIKCNIVIGLSDLTFRFPNIIEPWTGHFYSTLHEKNTELRLTAVKMLSHLILHEMIRVKGQIADLAMCIVDPDAEIKNITQQFFKEIANKSNILYNVLPDIISKLSDTNLNLEEEKYRIIMRYILGLIQKDRQVETLVEKLCLRFPVTREERQWRDIAYCLSLLSYNERTIKKLIDNIQHYKDKVQIDEVYQSFKLIISNTSKMAKPELKAAVVELETRINECLEINDGKEREDKEGGGGGGGGDSSTGRTEARGKRTKEKPGSTQRTRSGRRGRRGKSTSSESTISSEDEAPPSQKQLQRKISARSAQKPQRNRAAIADSSSSSSEEEEGVQSARGGRKAAAASVKGKQAASASKSAMAANKSRTMPRSRVIEDSASSDEEEEQHPQRKRGRGNRK